MVSDKRQVPTAITACLLALAVFCGLCMQTASAYAADYEFAFRGTDYEYEYVYDPDTEDETEIKTPVPSDPAIRLYGVSSGKASYDAKTKVLTLNNVKTNSSLEIEVGTTVKLVGKNSVQSIWADSSNLTITGTGSLSMKDGSLYCSGLTVKGGTLSLSKDSSISCETFTMSGGAIDVKKAQGISCNGDFRLSGGSIKATDNYRAIYVDGKFTMKGGTITTSGNTYAIEAGNGFAMKGGSVKSTDDDTAIHVSSASNKKAAAFALSKGSINITNAHKDAVMLLRTNMKMTGGTLKISKAYEDALYVSSQTYKGKAIGGKVSITGGAFSAVVRKPTKYDAVKADSMTNKVSCLKSIAGCLPNGARFKTGGNVYKIHWYSNAIIAKYGAKKTAVRLSKVKYGKRSYTIDGVGANAFNTAAGKKVKSIAFGTSRNVTTLSYIGKNAFANTKSLTSLFLPVSLEDTYKKGKSGFEVFKSYKLDSYTKMAKNALAKCGKGGGSSLTVDLGVTLWRTDSAYKQREASLKKILSSHGMSSKVKLKSYAY